MHEVTPKSAPQDHSASSGYDSTLPTGENKQVAQVIFPPEWHWTKDEAQAAVVHDAISRWGALVPERGLNDPRNTVYLLAEHTIGNATQLLHTDQLDRVARTYQGFLRTTPIAEQANIFASVSSEVIHTSHQVLDDVVQAGNSRVQYSTQIVTEQYITALVDKVEALHTTNTQQTQQRKFLIPFLLETVKTASATIDHDYQSETIQRQQERIRMLEQSLATPADHQQETVPLLPRGDFYFISQIPKLNVHTVTCNSFTPDLATLTQKKSPEDVNFGILVAPEAVSEGTNENERTLTLTADSAYAVVVPTNWQEELKIHHGSRPWFSMVKRIQSRPDLPVIDSSGTLIPRQAIWEQLTKADIPIESFEQNPADQIANFVAMFPDTKELFLAPAGVIEGLTIGTHTEMVMLQRKKYFGEKATNLPEFLLTEQDFDIWGITHDGAKAPAVENDAIREQHDYTEVLMRQVLPHLGYDEQKINLFITLMHNDWIGKYIVQPLKNPKEAILADMKQKAKECNIADEQFPAFFNTVVALYLSDASAYTSNAYTLAGRRGLISLDHVFAFDTENHTIGFSDNTTKQLQQLSEKGGLGKAKTYKEHFQELQSLALLA